MPRLTKIYTRTGDDGTTALGSRQRVPKDHLRVEAYGAVDELNALLGLALAQDLSDLSRQSILLIQNQLLHLGADLAFPTEDGQQVPRIESRHIDGLEKLIDEINAVVGPLQNFILPGGAPGAAALQVARAVCRRAERHTVTLARQENIHPENLHYLNRLSDLLFVMARYENNQQNIKEPLWDPHA